MRKFVARYLYRSAMSMTTEQFLNYLQYELNRSELTIASYGDDLRAFEAFFKNCGSGLLRFGPTTPRAGFFST